MRKALSPLDNHLSLHNLLSRSANKSSLSELFRMYIRGESREREMIAAQAIEERNNEKSYII